MTIVNRLRVTVLPALLMLCGSATQLWAQVAKDAPTESLKTHHAMAYGLVLLGIVLGIMNVVRPGKRKGEKPKPG